MDVEDMEPGVFYPWPEGVVFDRDAVRYAMATRRRTQTTLQRCSGRAARNEVEARARRTLADQADRQRRADDPYEKAKSFLQHRGYQVFSRSVCDPPKAGVQVGKRIFADASAVMEYARSLGWEGVKPVA